jgi:hypothetical protein
MVELEKPDVTAVTGKSGDRGQSVDPIVVVGDDMYPVLLVDAARDGHITEDELSQRYALHKLIEKTMNDPAAP